MRDENPSKLYAERKKNISLRLLYKALEKAIPRGIRSLGTRRPHTPPTTHSSTSIFSLSIATLSLPPPGKIAPFFRALRRFKFPA